ncbi:MAG: TonB-dependent receptor, partial [Acidobacteriota bacterium]
MKLLDRMRAAFALSSVLAMSGWAQTGTGAIQGAVRDPSGAVIPGAKVSVTHVATSRTWETVSNSVGFFIQPSLPIGPYKLVVEAPGMKGWEGRLELQAGQIAVVNPQMALGTTVTEIVVAGDVSSAIVTENATLGQVLERSRIEQLPINGRFLTTLVGVTTPGVDSGRVFGLRETAFEYIQDGAVLKNRDTGGHTGRPPGIDTVAEFKVETNNSSAKMNRPASTIIVTRSGANEIHGAVFETVRNNAIGVARRRQDYYRKPPQLVRNEFGASLGGPVWLPKLYSGRNRTFFFAAYEAYRLRQGATSSTTVPTMAMREGDFSGLIDSLGRRYTIYDPWTTTASWSRLPYADNRIPVNRRSPLATYLYGVTPAPSHPERNPLVTSNYFGPAPNNRDDHTFTARFDHSLGEQGQMFVRYSRGDSYRKYKSSDAAAVTLDGATNVTLTGSDMQNGVLSWTRSITPTLFSETILSLASEIFDVRTGTYEINHADRRGLPNPFRETGFPSITGTGFGMTYIQADTRRNNRTLVATVDQTFTLVRGRHEMHFGGKFRNERMHVLPDQQFVAGNHSFSSGATGLFDPTSGSAYGAVPRTGHDSANLFLGVAGTYGVQFVQKWYRFRDREYALFLQDNYKLSPRLTLNLGLRWEIRPSFHEADNLFTGFDPKTKSTVNGRSLEELYKLGKTTPEIVGNFSRIGVKFATPAEVGLPPSMLYPNYRDFGPRGGFAYKITTGKRPTVLRGGYALFRFPNPLRNFNARTRSNPPYNANFQVSITSAALTPDGRPNWGLRSAPALIAGVNSQGVIDPTRPGGVARGSFRTSYFDPEQPSTQAHQWNLTLEREVMDATVVRLGYIGNHASKLEQFYSYNEAPNSYVWYVTTGLPLPTGEYANVARRGFDQTSYGAIETYRKTGWSNFNGAQVEVQRRYKKGYAYQFFYVLSNAFRVAGDGWRDDLMGEPNVFLPGAVPADYAARNRFLNYRRDTGIPKHRFRWNWLVDLPFGAGKWLGGKAGPWLDRLIGGWQVAGFGSYRDNYWSLPTGNWGSPGQIEVYGKKYRVEDCRGGTCIPGYLYFNGYIPATRI